MKLKMMREKAGLTTIQVGKMIGCSPSAITNWESGSRKPDIEKLIRLTEILGCTADELLGIDRTGQKKEELVSGRTELLGIDRRKPAEEEKPETRGQEISVRMSEPLADARKRQEA